MPDYAPPRDFLLNLLATREAEFLAAQEENKSMTVKFQIAQAEQMVAGAAPSDEIDRLTGELGELKKMEDAPQAWVDQERRVREKRIAELRAEKLEAEEKAAKNAQDAADKVNAGRKRCRDLEGAVRFLREQVTKAG